MPEMDCVMASWPLDAVTYRRQPGLAKRCTHPVLHKRLRVLAVGELGSELGERGETLRVSSRHDKGNGFYDAVVAQEAEQDSR